MVRGRGRCALDVLALKAHLPQKPCILRHSELRHIVDHLLLANVEHAVDKPGGDARALLQEDAKGVRSHTRLRRAGRGGVASEQRGEGSHGDERHQHRVLERSENVAADEGDEVPSS